MQGRLSDHLGTFTVGVPTVDARAEIVRLRAAGYGTRTIARTLNARGVPTPSGRGQWHPATVQRHADPAPWAAYIARYRARQRREPIRGG